MFRPARWTSPNPPCFPRIRGDVPCQASHSWFLWEFSPHTRGCSVARSLQNQRRIVFPAYAGMFRDLSTIDRISPGFPRIRGDVPGCTPAPGKPAEFSPHTRGCSDKNRKEWLPGSVFPAYAGMFLMLICWLKIMACFPRIRGDVPAGSTPRWRRSAFSPHTRGCSAVSKAVSRAWSVFPAYAGMFRADMGVMANLLGFPRIRGDVPANSNSSWVNSEFSPHTRGCSVNESAFVLDAGVFPAYAGMFLSVPCATVSRSRFPRIRGDVPVGVIWWWVAC